ncbi:MAG TPA: hypothetical protein VEU95_08885 [Micropepsaceae bacterium]|nr:hypothetical protein [Micropepsaceae bacterium]
MPFIKTQVILFEEKSGISLLGTRAGCARNAGQTATVQRRSAVPIDRESNLRGVARAFMTLFSFRAETALSRQRLGPV